MNCPVTRKWCFGSRPEALKAREHSGQRTFHCERCGWWHLTGSNTPGTWQAKEPQ